MIGLQPLPAARRAAVRLRRRLHGHQAQRHRRAHGRRAGAQRGQHQLRGLRPLQPGLRDRGPGLRPVRDRAGRGRGGRRPGHRAELLQQPHDRGRRYGRGAERASHGRSRLRARSTMQHPGLLLTSSPRCCRWRRSCCCSWPAGCGTAAARYRDTGWGESLYWLFGGDRPGKGGAYVATAAIGLACVLQPDRLRPLHRRAQVVPAPAHAEQHHAGHEHGQARRGRRTRPRARRRAQTRARRAESSLERPRHLG